MAILTTPIPAETLATSPFRYTLVDLFAGSGGLSLGLERAGFRPIFVNELNPHAMETYLSNRRESYPDLNRRHAYDIHDLTRDDAVLNHLNTLRLDAEGKSGIADVDLVVGGPPCQGYSRIGHRRTFSHLSRRDTPSNHLYESMAAVIEALAPKAFLFENVKGLLSGRWTPDGDPGEIWRDVWDRFSNLSRVDPSPAGYDVRAAVLHAKDYGVPQNRPRVLIVGIRRDLGWRPAFGLVADGLLPEPSGRPAPDPVEVLGDLVDGDYVNGGVSKRYPSDPQSPTQIMLRTDPKTGLIARRGAVVTEHDYSNHRSETVRKFQWMIDHDGQILEEHQTKKFAQRVIPRDWGPSGPTITTTSLPDDYVHFSQPRTLTVREWARLQTFPDWYQFAGPRTTGGRRRAGDPHAGDWRREAPKYTQIGNAVPVQLAEAVGRHLIQFLS